MTRHVSLHDQTLGLALSRSDYDAGRVKDLAQRLRGFGLTQFDLGEVASSCLVYDRARALLPHLSGAHISVQAPCRRSDIALSVELIKADKAQGVIHLSLDLSPQSPGRQSGRPPAYLLDDIYRSVCEVRDEGLGVHFTARKALHTERGLLIEALNVAVQAGAQTLGAADDTGYGTPGEMTALFRHVRNKVDRARHLTLSAYCHNLLGMAVANSLAAIQGGASAIATQWGQSAGRYNVCSLDDVMMALAVRRDALSIHTDVEPSSVINAPLLAGSEVKPDHTWAYAVGE